MLTVKTSGIGNKDCFVSALFMILRMLIFRLYNFIIYGQIFSELNTRNQQKGYENFVLR